MAKYEIFSKRQKILRGDVPDVFTYDRIPLPLRVQVIHIWGDTLGHQKNYPDMAGETYTALHDKLCREYGCFDLVDESYVSAEDKLRKYLETCGTENALDVIELSFRYIDTLLRDGNARYRLGSITGAAEAIDELNERFRWHGVGYQFESGLIIRVDSAVSPL